jgi:hypothetical protein
MADGKCVKSFTGAHGERLPMSRRVAGAPQSCSRRLWSYGSEQCRRSRNFGWWTGSCDRFIAALGWRLCRLGHNRGTGLVCRRILIHDWDRWKDGYGRRSGKRSCGDQVNCRLVRFRFALCSEQDCSKHGAGDHDRHQQRADECLPGVLFWVRVARRFCFHQIASA